MGGFILGESGGMRTTLFLSFSFFQPTHKPTERTDLTLPSSSSIPSFIWFILLFFKKKTRRVVKSCLRNGSHLSPLTFFISFATTTTTLMYSSTLPKTPAVFFFFSCRDNFNPEMMMTFKRKIFWTSRAALLYVKAQTGREQRGNKNDDLMRKSRRRGTVDFKIKIRKVTQVRQGKCI